MHSDHASISLINLPPTARQTRATLIGAGALLLGLAVLAPFAATPLSWIVGFIPAFDAIIAVTDLITAGLLLAQSSITHSRAIWALACGYLFSAAIVVAHGLTFPGSFFPHETPGATSHVNFRLYLLWHLGLPVAMFTYVWLRAKDHKAGAPTPINAAATTGAVAAAALITSIAWLALIPPVDPIAGRWLTAITMLICVAALVVLWIDRRSILDQWLVIVLLSMLVELALTALIGGRGPRTTTLGFYSGRLFSLVTSTVVLIALLAETSKLYADVARANSLAGAVKASHDLSSEIELPQLTERLLTIAVQNARANRGVLLLRSSDEYLGQAEAYVMGDRVEVTFHQHPGTGIACPRSLIRHVIRTRARVVLDDASEPNPFSDDDYLRARRSKSILCLPLIKQRELIGMLLLENALTTHAFMPDRIAVLELLADQAAIALENAALYSDLQLQVEILQHLPVSAWTLKPDGTPDFVNQRWLSFSGQTMEFVRSRPEAWMSAVHPEDQPRAAMSFWDGVHSARGFAFETRTRRAEDGAYRWHLQQAAVLHDSEGNVVRFVGTTTDIDAHRRTEEALRQSQSDLARIHRITTMGELAASLAHEVNQPISGAITNANVCLRHLLQEQPDIAGLRAAVTRIVRDTKRAADIVGRIRSQFKRDAMTRELVDVNEIHQETVTLMRDEAVRYNVSVRTELAVDLPPILGDRVQLLQVMMNLAVNGIEAMKDVAGTRELILMSQQAEDGQILVSVGDTGIGFPPETAEQLFAPFFTTKPSGTGMGLRICRSIVESHAGRLWANGVPGRGATFHFMLPAAMTKQRSTPDGI